MSKLRDLSLLAGRAVLGSYLAAHGAQKLWGAFGGPGLGPVAGAFDRIGLRPGRAMAMVAATSELGGGLLTATGLADPLGPLAIAGTMAVAATTHRAKGPFAANGGYELALTNLGAALTLAANGPGGYSLDHLTGYQLPKRLVRVVTLSATCAALAHVAMVLRAGTPSPAPTEAASPQVPASDAAEGPREDEQVGSRR